jgi:hypothetical protein
VAKANGSQQRVLVRFGAYVYQDQLDALTKIQEETGVPVARMIRDGIDRELASRGVKVGGPKHGR